jgi:hypothetical protein
MIPLYDYTTEWSVEERRTAARLLAQAAGCLQVFAEIRPGIDTPRELAADINAALWPPKEPA